MQPGENKSHVVLTRLKEQKKLHEQAAEVVAQTVTMHERMGKSEPEDE